MTGADSLPSATVRERYCHAKKRPQRTRDRRLLFFCSCVSVESSGPGDISARHQAGGSSWHEWPAPPRETTYLSGALYLTLLPRAPAGTARGGAAFAALGLFWGPFPPAPAPAGGHTAAASLSSAVPPQISVSAPAPSVLRRAAAEGMAPAP